MEVSDNGGVIIEKYMGNTNDFNMTYLFVKGEPYLIKLADRFLGTVESGMDRNCIASMSPSRYTDMYMKNVHPRIVNMIRGLGIMNGPVFMQGFVDGDTVRFYDPGFRFPGAEYELMTKAVWGLDVMKMMVEYALAGEFKSDFGPLVHEPAYMKQKPCGMLLPTIGEGIIGEIDGFDEVGKIPQVVCYTVRHKVGDIIKSTHDVNQLLCEISIIADNLSEYREVIKRIQALLTVKDTDGNDMFISNFDVNEIRAFAYGSIDE